MKIFIASIPSNMIEADLQAAFSIFGIVSSVKVIADKSSGQSNRFGIIEMHNDGCALAAISALNGTWVDGRALVISQAEDNHLHRVNLFQAAGYMGNRNSKHIL